MFVDETSIPNPSSHFMWGAILQPIDCDLAARLGDVRLKYSYVHCLHFADKARFGTDETNVIKGFLDAFVKSNACYRSLIASPANWSSINSWDSKARLAGLLFSYPWMPAKGEIYNIMSRARLIFDRNSMNQKQVDVFHRTLSKVLRQKNEIFETLTKSLRDPAIVFADKHLFDELQLVDILNGIVRIGYLLKSNKYVSPAKKELYDYLLLQYPQLNSFVASSRLRTRQQINVWEFSPRSRN
jgi:hypothetical protein